MGRTQDSVLSLCQVYIFLLGPLLALFIPPQLPTYILLTDFFVFIYLLNKYFIVSHYVSGSVCSRRLVYFSEQKQTKVPVLVGRTVY